VSFGPSWVTINTWRLRFRWGKMKLVGERPGARLVETAQNNAIHGRERRRAVRNAVHTPAYASLNGSAQAVSLVLCEILNISESGTCIQSPGQMKVKRLLPLALDLSATGDRIYTTGHVVWSESCGRAGIRFPELPEISLLQLRRWLQANDAAGGATVAVAQSDSHAENESDGLPHRIVRARPASAAGYSSLIAEWVEIEKEVELFGPNVSAALQLIAERALVLTWATGSAIAMRSDVNSSELICEARAGNESPELGARLDTDSGFSGECVRGSSTLICDDTEIDPRVDPKSCQRLGIRSIVACPIIVDKNQNIGILEVFSPEAAAFWDNDARTLERLARIITNAMIRAKQPVGKTPLIDQHEGKQENKLELKPHKTLESEALTFGPSSRARLAILFACGIAVVIFSVWLAAPWISDAMTKFTSPPSSQAAEVKPANADYVGMTVADLQKIALQNDSAAQYSLGMKYASGDGTAKDYHAALNWFLKAADNGNPRAAVKVASCFWAGKGTQQDFSRAYFWGLLAQAAGDETGRVIVINSAPHLSDHQRFAEQQEADSWLRSHHMGSSTARASR
jgi:putative methionine-R-sulfoxide reductase with GAF domain